MPIKTITISRLYNLGSYEHVKYEIGLELQKGDSPSKTLVALERIMEALSPNKDKTQDYEVEREERRVNDMLA